MAIYVEDLLPGVKQNGLNTKSAIDFSGAASMSLPSGATLTSPTVSTGDITLTTGNVVLSANGAGISFTGTAANGGILTNLYNTASTTLSGTQKDIKILIGTVPYYWTVYPTKA